MAVQITKVVKKAKAKAKAKSKQVDQILVDAVDQYGTLKQMEADVKEELAKIASALKEPVSIMQEAVMNVDPAEKHTMKGNHFVVEASARSNVTHCEDNALAFNALESVQEGLGLDLMKFGITDLKKYLSEIQYQDFLITGRTGRRSFKAVELGE